MTIPTETRDSLHLIKALLQDVADRLTEPSKGDRRIAALKLNRIVAIASTLAATIHTPRQS